MASIYHWQPYYAKYPIVNINYNEAEEFCKWLTKKYNSTKNRRYKKVIIRLPKEAEWEMAASGLLNGSPYPWKGAYTRNSKGRFLGNFSPVEERNMDRNENGDWIVKTDDYREMQITDIDGGFITVPVKSYLPNRIGIYNISGNVAEMVAEKNILKGGSWKSREHEIQIQEREEYTGASATVGFRVLMEIVEQ